MRERIFSGLLRNISSGTRLALFLPVRWLQFRASPGQFALLAGFNFLVWWVSSTLQAGGGVLNPMAIAVYLAQIPMLLLASLLIATSRGNVALTLLLAVALSASDLAFELAGMAILGTQPNAAAQWAFLAWGWLVAMRAILVCTGITWRQIGSPAVIVTVLMAISLF